MRYIPAKAILIAFTLAPFLIYSCNNSNDKKNKPVGGTPQSTVQKTTDVKKGSDSVSGNEEIPVLCYHQIRDWKPTDSKSSEVYIVPVESFKEQMKMLHDSGYNYILPDQLMAYLEKKGKLPPHPIMLTFDDADGSQYTNALLELDKNGFKGLFFIMTVVLGHPNYMSRENVKYLSTHGHVIGCHTWNHKNVVKYKDEDWPIQVEKPLKELTTITGMPVKYFAYPFGTWNNNAVEHIKQYGFTAAFRLWGKYDTQDAFFKLRRILVAGEWKPGQFINAIKKDPLKNLPEK